MGAEHRVGDRKSDAPEVEGAEGLGPNELRAYAAALRTDQKRRRAEQALEVMRCGHTPVSSLDMQEKRVEHNMLAAKDPVVEQKVWASLI